MITNLANVYFITLQLYPINSSLIQLSFLQIRMLLEKANALAEKWNGIPIVLAGDFNSTPDVCFKLLIASVHIYRLKILE